MPRIDLGLAAAGQQAPETLSDMRLDRPVLGRRDIAGRQVECQKGRQPAGFQKRVLRVGPVPITVGADYGDSPLNSTDVDRI